MESLAKKLESLGLHQRIMSGGGVIVACIALSSEEIAELAKQKPDQYNRIMVGPFRVTIKNGALSHIVARIADKDTIIVKNAVSAGHLTFSTSREAVEIGNEADIKKAIELNKQFSTIAQDEILVVLEDGKVGVVKTAKHLAANGVKV